MKANGVEKQCLVVLNVSILITLCFRFRYIENITLYLNGGVLIYMYKQSNTVSCLSYLQRVQRVHNFKD